MSLLGVNETLDTCGVTRQRRFFFHRLRLRLVIIVVLACVTRLLVISVFSSIILGVFVNDWLSLNGIVLMAIAMSHLLLLYPLFICYILIFSADMSVIEKLPCMAMINYIFSWKMKLSGCRRRTHSNKKGYMMSFWYLHIFKR